MAALEQAARRAAVAAAWRRRRLGNRDVTASRGVAPPSPRLRRLAVASCEGGRPCGTLGLSSLEERLQPARPRRVPQLAQRLRLDLPDALAGDREALTDLFERVLGAFADAEAHLDDALLARRQRLQDVVRLLLQVQVDHRIRRRPDV